MIELFRKAQEETPGVGERVPGATGKVAEFPLLAVR